MAKFEMQGIESLDNISKNFTKTVQKKLTNAAEKGTVKALENIVYGQSERISHSRIKPDSAVATAAKALRIKPHHVYFRTFIKGAKSRKPYSVAMLRANSINPVSLLVDNVNDAKKMYGFKGRKGKINKSQKQTPANMKQLVAGARVGGRKSGRVKIGSRNYTNAFIEDGSFRNSSDYWKRYYVRKLGADPDRSLRGNNYLLIRKKNPNQELPYPTVAVKIESEKVLRAFRSSLTLASKRRSGSTQEIQNGEVLKEMRKLGWDVR